MPNPFQDLLKALKSGFDDLKHNPDQQALAILKEIEPIIKQIAEDVAAIKAIVTAPADPAVGIEVTPGSPVSR